jgi:hypothetical protein
MILNRRRSLSAACQLPIDKLQPVLAPENLVADDIAGGAEHAAVERRPGLGDAALGPAPSFITVSASRPISVVPTLGLEPRAC